MTAGALMDHWTKSVFLSVAFVGLAACAAADPHGIRAPRIVSTEKMVGAIHVSWINDEPACDEIDVERSEQFADGHVEAFAVLYRLPGAADNKHDVTAT